MAASANNGLDDLAVAISNLKKPNFPTYLGRFLRTLSAYDNLLVLAYREEQRPIILYKESKWPVVFANLDEYQGGAYLLDPLFHLHMDQVEPGMYRMRDVAPDQFKRSAYYHQYYKATTLIDEIAFYAYTPGQYTVSACVGRTAPSNRPFPRRAIANLRSYEPVICSLIGNHWESLGTPAANSRAAATDDNALAGKLAEAASQMSGLRLSRRQAQVALMILQGHSSRSIAMSLGISHHTAKVHRKQLYAKCGISSQAELFALMLPVMGEFFDGDALPAVPA